MKPGNDLGRAGLCLSAGIATCEINCRTPVDRSTPSQIPPKRKNRRPRWLGDGSSTGLLPLFYDPARD